MQAKEYRIEQRGGNPVAVIEWMPPYHFGGDGQQVVESAFNRSSLQSRIANIEAAKAGNTTSTVEKAALSDLDAISTTTEGG